MRKYNIEIEAVLPWSGDRVLCHLDVLTDEDGTHAGEIVIYPYWGESPIVDLSSGQVETMREIVFEMYMESLDSPVT